MKYYIDKKYSIIGNLYYFLKNNQLLPAEINNSNFFLDDIFMLRSDNPALLHNELWANISKQDYFPAKYLKIASKSLEAEDVFIENLELYTQVSDFNFLLISKWFIDIIDFCKKERRNLYDPEFLEALGTYYKIKQNSGNLTRSLYLLLFLAVKKKLPHNFYFGASYSRQLDEFNNLVLCKYGLNSTPGHLAIIQLAEKGNIFALHELADLYYYNQLNDLYISSNYEKAIELYYQSAGYDKINNSVNRDSCNPLALWSLSYIFFNYHRRLDLKNIVSIPELENWTADQRLIKAIDFAQKATRLTECGPAENILGIITLYLNENQTELSPFLKNTLNKEYSLESPSVYFKRAANHKYLHAYTNLAEIESKLIFEDDSNQAKHIKQYIEYLEKAASYHEPYVLNRLGLIYLTGEIEVRNMKREVIYSKTFEIKNRNKAHYFFKEAISYFYDASIAWPLANLLVYFPEDYQNNELFTKHIRMLEHLKQEEPINFVKQNRCIPYSLYK